MDTGRPTVVVTGIAGNLGQRLLLNLPEFDVIGVDMAPPRHIQPHRFERIDLGEEESCQSFINLLRETGATAVVHLAFVIDPVQTGVLDVDRMWRINVAGTARIMEAIAEVNRFGGAVRKFVFPSSVSAYGPHLPGLVKEDYPLGAHTLPYAIHKQESDDVARMRAESLGECTTYILRPHIFAGATMSNYLIGALRGTPGGKGRMGAWMRARNQRLPLLLPYGERYLMRRFQFVHVDDVARLIAYILRRPERAAELTILNVAGQGDPVTIQLCARLAHQKIVRLPFAWMCRAVLALLWKLGISSVPADAFPYMIGSYLMDTHKLRAFLGADYERVIQYSVEGALRDSFAPPTAAAPPAHVHRAANSA
jgi:nucleoside-diphosphate-sugar epimerase